MTHGTGTQTAASPLISVVTVTLNPGEDLARTAASVDAQEFGGYEHVVKDGCSSDGSVENLPANPRRRVVRVEDVGIYDAMNQALDTARGSWILFLNAGDTLAAPTALGRLSEALQNVGDAELIYFDYFSEALGAVVGSPSRLSEFFLYRTMLCHQACLFNASVYERLGMFDLQFKVAADFDFLSRAVLRDSVKGIYLGSVLTSYKGNGFSTSASNRTLLQSEVRAIRARYTPPIKRIVFRLIYAATLPGLRQWAASQASLGRLYNGLVKVFYRSTGRLISKRKNRTQP